MVKYNANFIKKRKLDRIQDPCMWIFELKRGLQLNALFVLLYLRTFP